MPIKRKDPLFTNPLEAASGLTIADLNRYLPAVRRVEDMTLAADAMTSGIYLGLCLEGLKRIPENTIDLIIADPPESPWRNVENQGAPMTLQEYFQWNENWLKQSHRILKSTGAIYLITGWRYSGMYHSLLNHQFKIQTRITWRNSEPKDRSRKQTWVNRSSDIWFATKTNDILFNQEALQSENDTEIIIGKSELGITNLWSDILDINSGSDKMGGDKPELLIQRILNASSFKLNWVVDPFLRNGGTGKIVKRMGRRLIGFEPNQDSLLMAMKRIDNEQ